MGRLGWVCGFYRLERSFVSLPCPIGEVLTHPLFRGHKVPTYFVWVWSERALADRDWDSRRRRELCFAVAVVLFDIVFVERDILHMM